MARQGQVIFAESGRGWKLPFNGVRGQSSGTRVFNMAAFGRVCLSMAFTGPLIYPTLCSRHRLLWSSLHRQGCVAFSCSSHRSKKKSVGTSKGVTSARKILPNATDSKENNNAGLPEASMAVMEEVVAESTVNEDLIKLRFPSKTTKELSFEKQPHRPRSSVMFTIGKEAVTLETAEAAVAKRRSLHNESLTECDSVPERPPSLGLSVKRSRTNPPSESTQEMLHYLDTHHKLFQKTRNLYSQALPSLLGVGVEEVTNTSDELEGVGFSPEVVDRLLSAFPHILEVNFENVYKVFTVLRKYLRHDNRVYGLILSHPFLFTLDPSQVGVCGRAVCRCECGCAIVRATEMRYLCVLLSETLSVWKHEVLQHTVYTHALD